MMSTNHVPNTVAMQTSQHVGLRIKSELKNREVSQLYTHGHSNGFVINLCRHVTDFRDNSSTVGVVNGFRLR